MPPPAIYEEPDWQDWRALLAPWPEGATAIAALDAANAFGILCSWRPLLIGTIPIGLAVAGSDIDIACDMPDPAAAQARLRAAFGRFRVTGDRLVQRDGLSSLVFGFEAGGQAIEIFGQPVPARAQLGHCHLRAERLLLWHHGAALRDAVLALKRRGMKTEPAFVRALGLPAADPYRQVLDHASAVAAGAGLALRF